MHGKGCYKLTFDEIDNKYKISMLFNKVLSSRYIFQEHLSQHPRINKVCSTTINTLRLDTFNDKNNNVEIYQHL